MCEHMEVLGAVAVIVLMVETVAAQESELETCYGGGSIVGAIIGTLLVTVAVLASCFLLHKIYWRSRKGKHLVLVTDAENPGDQYAFDNPCFREATPIKHSLHDEKTNSKLEPSRWLDWSSLQNFGGQRVEKVKSMDDSCLNEPHLKVVSLKSHDFTGLGFNICGNMRDGIFVKDVLHRGPAFESGCINSGDRIDSVRISFRNMVFEDALTILSYASPYEVQVHVENGCASRPSTLIRSKRESNAVHAADRILHPKYNRSQSISDLTELNRTHKRMNQSHTSDRSRLNTSHNKPLDTSGSANDYPTLKLTTHHEPKQEQAHVEKKSAPQSHKSESYHEREVVASAQPSEPGNKFQKFGIKVLPINMNPKMGTQVVSGNHMKNKHDMYNRLTAQNEKNSAIEKSEGVNQVPETGQVSDLSPGEKKDSKKDEVDGGIDNVKSILSKGFQNLKEKINQNTLGRKKNKEGNENEAEAERPTENSEENSNHNVSLEEEVVSECPVPTARSTVQPPGKKRSPETCNGVPEEVTRAGDVARNNRRSSSDMLATPRKSVANLSLEAEPISVNSTTVSSNKSTATVSSSDSSSDRDSPRDAGRSKRPKRSKGKAPAPPQKPEKKEENIEIEVAPPKPSQVKASGPNNVNEIQKESDINDSADIFEPMENLRGPTRTPPPKEPKPENIENYDSDSDTESALFSLKEPGSGTKIELNTTQVTIHHSPTMDNGNEDDLETSRKAASLGDLSKLESDHTLSVVLERAVSLDLADGSSQSAKKRKAPLPPPEDFPSVFDDAGYRKEPRLDNQLGLNTFQRRLKKSSDFGTLEDALQDGPKSLDEELTASSPVDIVEAHNTNIQEFSSWLAECRKPKPGEEDHNHKATSLVNVNVANEENEALSREDSTHSFCPNVVFSVNGMNMQEKTFPDTQSANITGVASRTVLVISQPNSLEATSMAESLSLPEAESITKEYLLSEDHPASHILSDCDTSNEPFTTANESQLDSTFKVDSIEEEADDDPPQLPSTPMPLTNSSFSTPLSTSLTYITEVKVTTAEPDSTTEIKEGEHASLSSLSSDSMGDDIDSPNTVVSSTPKPSKIQDLLRSNLGEIKREPKPLRTDRSLSLTENALHSHNTAEEPPDYNRRGSDTTYEYSKIPIRTMKSETGQKVLATIQSLAAKETGNKTPESEYAKRVASLFSSANTKLESTQRHSSDSGSFFLQSPDNEQPRKIPPVVPPRKTDTTLSSKTTVTVETPPSEGQTDRNVVTFSSFMTENRPGSKIASWNSTLSNGEHVPTGVVNLPVKTSATKIVFERKELDNEEF